jgi:hypothetical protein
MKLTLPKKNMTKKNYNSLTRQVCVIPNSEENRKAIKHLNTLAKEQHSEYRFSYRYRCPKEGKYGNGGEVAKDNANGLGLYIDGASHSDAMADLEAKDQRIYELHSQIIDLKKKHNSLWDKYIDVKRLIREKELINQKIKELI